MDQLRIVASRRYGTLSPLRYPGGKAALAGLFADIVEHLDSGISQYVEPYAGGAGAGIALIHRNVVDHLVINDIDPAVHAFWRAVTEHNDEFIEATLAAPLTVEEWNTQRAIYREGDVSDTLRLGFAFFYLNRTNRSGVLNAGVIGGKNQSGRYRIDARFNRATLVTRLERIGQLRDRITVTDLDGRTTIRRYANDRSTFMYIDPPYVDSGSRLYMNAFDGRDHRSLAEIVNAIEETHWLVTYDTSPLVEKIYSQQFQCRLQLSYSARYPGRAEELLIASPSVASAITRVVGC